MVYNKMKEEIFGHNETKRLLLFGIAVTIFVILIAVYVMVSSSQSREKGIDLMELNGISHGWKYELLTSSGKQEYKPEYSDDFTLYYGEEMPQAVRISRILSEQTENAELIFNLGTSSGIEVKLNDWLLYSDYNGACKDKNDFLILNEVQKRQVWPIREIKISLPEDYVGQVLTVTTYFSEIEEYFTPAYPILENDLTYFSPYAVDSVLPAMAIAFLE